MLGGIFGNTLDISINLCICAGTLAMFCLGQGIFWIMVSSKQFENVIKDKVQIANLFLEEENSQLRVAFCANLKAQVTSETIEDIKKTEQENIQMMKNRIWGFFSTTTGFFAFMLAFVLYRFSSEISNASPDKVSKLHAKKRGFVLALFLVLFSFSTEILIFEFIIKPYITIGDMEMLYEMVKES